METTRNIISQYKPFFVSKIAFLLSVNVLHCILLNQLVILYHLLLNNLVLFALIQIALSFRFRKYRSFYIMHNYRQGPSNTN